MKNSGENTICQNSAGLRNPERACPRRARRRPSVAAKSSALFSTRIPAALISEPSTPVVPAHFLSLAVDRSAAAFSLIGRGIRRETDRHALQLA